MQLLFLARTRIKYSKCCDFDKLSVHNSNKLGLGSHTLSVAQRQIRQLPAIVSNFKSRNSHFNTYTCYSFYIPIAVQAPSCSRRTRRASSTQVSYLAANAVNCKPTVRESIRRPRRILGLFTHVTRFWHFACVLQYVRIDIPCPCQVTRCPGVAQLP